MSSTVNKSENKVFNCVSGTPGKYVFVLKGKSMMDQSNWIVFDKPGRYDFYKDKQGNVTWTTKLYTPQHVCEDICITQYQ